MGMGGAYAPTFPLATLM